MRKIFVLLFGLFIMVSACKKDSSSGIKGCKDVNSVNYNPLATSDDGSCLYPDSKFRPLVIEYTSTCCHYCGEWGHDTFENLIAKYKDNIIPISIHRNLNSCTDIMLLNDLYTSFNAERPSGLPSFAINDAPLNGGYSAVVSTTSKDAPYAGIVFTSKLSGDTMIVNTATKFLDNPINDKWFGEWDINVYILESGMPGNQSAGSYAQATDHVRADYKHNYTLRTAAITSSAYGVVLATGSAASPIAEFSTVKKQFKILLNNSWNYSNLKVVAIVWSKNTSGHKYINGYIK